MNRPTVTLDKVLPHHTSNWNGQLACLRVDAHGLEHGWDLSASIFSFTLIKQGQLRFVYNGEEIQLEAGDLHTYAPGVHSKMLSVSEDYCAELLSVDEGFVYDTPLMNHFIRASYSPLCVHKRPSIRLSPEQSEVIEATLQLIQRYLALDSSLKGEMLTHLCEVFCMTLIDIQGRATDHPEINPRTELLFSSFLSLVSAHAHRERNLRFYAQKLSISVTYLSRIVRQVSGQSAMSFIEHALTWQALSLLKNSTLSVSEIAYRLHFADVASFSRFFSRTQGLSPSNFRRSLGPSSNLGIPSSAIVLNS